MQQPLPTLTHTVASSIIRLLLPFRPLWHIKSVHQYISVAQCNIMCLTVYISSGRVKFRKNIGKVFKKPQHPKKVNRPSDRKLKKNGSSKSEPYLKNEPFSSYGPKKGFQKRA